MERVLDISMTAYRVFAIVVLAFVTAVMGSILFAFMLSGADIAPLATVWVAIAFGFSVAGLIAVCRCK